MTGKKVYRAIGLMSGTSLDGVDAALIETDGYGLVRSLSFITKPYEQRVRDKIRSCFGLRDKDESRAAEAGRLLTFAHVDAVMELASYAGYSLENIDVIGFHGQTITHDPKAHFTLQIGDGDLLAEETGISVVDDFRSNDVSAGGQGAPFLPLYHQALARAAGLETPLAVLNIGGVANVTWIGEGDDDLLAFDTGPGNALIDDFVFGRTGENFDKNGALAKMGTVDRALVESWMAMPYFARPTPKSLDRNQWDVSAADYLSDEDGAATLTAFTVEAVEQAAHQLKEKPKQWLISGGGRHNRTIMDFLRIGLGVPVKAVESVGWNGDALEAEGFGYLAVRSLLKQPLSLPTTTGVSEPLTGGRLHKAA